MYKAFKFGLVTLAFGLLASTAHAAALAPMAVFTDSTADGVVLADAQPPFADLIEGSIGETDDALQFVWKVADLPPGGVPEVAGYFWEFTLDDPNDSNPAAQFSLRAHLAPATSALATPGDLRGNCTTTGTVVSCSKIPASVTVSVDDVNNTVTASVKRADLKGKDGNSVANSGATLVEAVLFQGIAAYVSPYAVGTSGAGGDQADMDDTYVLGTPRG